MQMLDDYMNLQKQLFDYFGYVEDWCVIPIDDARQYHWQIIGSESDGCVRFAEHKGTLEDEENEDYYENTIYTQRFLPKWVYHGKDYTMICVDTHVDGNKLLQIFSNELEYKQ